jgi:CheY-like chemotaxis protein
MSECYLSAHESECRVLLVESSPELLRLMVLVIEDAGYTPVPASSPREAAALLADGRFDMVITDSFSRSARENLESLAPLLQAAREIPVLLCTGHRFPFDDLRRLGIDAVIEKPYDPAELVSHVHHLCKLASAPA